MKKLILIILIPFLCTYVNAQKSHKKVIKQNWRNAPIDPKKFTGIGFLKIGSDTSILFQTIDKNEIMEDGYEYNDPPELKKYEIGTYEVAGIKITGIKVSYYKGKLIEFYSDDTPDLDDAIKQKYGEPKVQEIKKTCQCLYNLTGITRNLEDVNYLSSWNNGPILVFNSVHKGYDENCKVTFTTYFTYSIENKELEDWREAHTTDITRKKDLTGF